MDGWFKTYHIFWKIYRKKIPTNAGIFKLEQCPYSGYFLFYFRVANSVSIFNLVSMPLLGLLPFLHSTVYGGIEVCGKCVNALTRATSFSTTFRQINNGKYDMCQCPYSGYFLFYPILFGKKPYFPSLPSVFIFSALFHKFLAYMAYIGTFLHLHNLNKAISHIFSKNYFDFLFAPLLSCTFFSCQVFKIA